MALPQSHALPYRAETRAQIIHTTGDGLTATLVHAGCTDAAKLGDAAIDWYRRTGLNTYGHSLIAPSGDVYELAEEDRVCWHAAPLDRRYATAEWREWAQPPGEEWQKHGRDPARVWDWWNARWPGVETPAKLAAGDHPNYHTVALDLLPLPTGGYSEAQIASAAQLIRERAARFGLPLDRAHVLGHEDVDPCRRGAVVHLRTDAQGNRVRTIVGVPWDPGAEFWAALNLEAQA